MMHFKGTPLFGQDSSPHYTSKIVSLLGTAIFWIFLFICMAVIKPSDKKTVYKEIQIVLSSAQTKPVEETPVQQKTVQNKAEQEKNVQNKIEQEKNVQSLTEQQKASTKKTEKTSNKTAAKTSQKVELSEDPMEAFARQTSKKVQKEFDWSVFDDEPVENAATSTEVTEEPFELFSGTAGNAATNQPQKITSSSSQKQPADENNNANSQTSDALNSLKQVKKYESLAGTANGINSKTEVKIQNNGNGKVMMEMSNGKARALLNPKEPVINLSKEAAATIDGNKEVKITFTVLPNGNTINISISPSYILKDIVQNEIKEQLGKWIFDSADYTAQATFNYKIIKE